MSSRTDVPSCMVWLRSAVRPLVTYAFALALIAGFFLGQISADVFSSIAIGVITFWFGQRSGEKMAQNQHANETEE